MRFLSLLALFVVAQVAEANGGLYAPRARSFQFAPACDTCAPASLPIYQAPPVTYSVPRFATVPEVTYTQRERTIIETIPQVTYRQVELPPLQVFQAPPVYRAPAYDVPCASAAFAPSYGVRARAFDVPCASASFSYGAQRSFSTYSSRAFVPSRAFAPSYAVAPAAINVNVINQRQRGLLGGLLGGRDRERTVVRSRGIFSH